MGPRPGRRFCRAPLQPAQGPNARRAAQVWTPLQYARALCSAFPWTLDPLSVANCLAAAAGEPDAEALLQGRVPPGVPTGHARLDPAAFLAANSGLCSPMAPPMASPRLPLSPGSHSQGGSGGWGSCRG